MSDSAAPDEVHVDVTAVSVLRGGQRHVAHTHAGITPVGHAALGIKDEVQHLRTRGDGRVPCGKAGGEKCRLQEVGRRVLEHLRQQLGDEYPDQLAEVHPVDRVAHRAPARSPLVAGLEALPGDEEAAHCHLGVARLHEPPAVIHGEKVKNPQLHLHHCHLANVETHGDAPPRSSPRIPNGVLKVRTGLLLVELLRQCPAARRSRAGQARETPKT
mmetsp:Transcript_82906/g.247315  ORF Transcript_82906/g.247315 Transcript_82906/m.247315 type:complete len:215 (-) Transcript_82906:427-1071(-)